jgi:flagellar biosynthesis protein FlhB
MLTYADVCGQVKKDQFKTEKTTEERIRESLAKGEVPHADVC